MWGGGREVGRVCRERREKCSDGKVRDAEVAGLGVGGDGGGRRGTGDRGRVVVGVLCDGARGCGWSDGDVGCLSVLGVCERARGTRTGRGQGQGPGQRRDTATQGLERELSRVEDPTKAGSTCDGPGGGRVRVPWPVDWKSAVAGGTRHGFAL